jgi:hypothetical protein
MAVIWVVGLAQLYLEEVRDVAPFYTPVAWAPYSGSRRDVKV